MWESQHRVQPMRCGFRCFSNRVSSPTLPVLRIKTEFLKSHPKLGGFLGTGLDDSALNGYSNGLIFHNLGLYLYRLHIYRAGRRQPHKGSFFYLEGFVATGAPKLGSIQTCALMGTYGALAFN